MNRTTTLKSQAIDVSFWIFIGILAYMPLHIFISTWIGTSFGILSIMRVLKDIVMLGGFATILTTSLKKSWFKELLRDRLIWLILAYGLLTVLLALFKPTDTDAEILGLVYNTRFLVFFLYAVMLNKSMNSLKLRKYSLIAVMSSALVVLCFGVIQYTVLPNSALEHVGYKRSNGVLPAFFIDEKPDLERAMSTLRDPNSFGSYVIIVGTLALALLFRKPKYRDLALGFLFLSLLCLWYSFSRSAWIGFVAATLTLLFMVFLKVKLSPKTLKIVWAGLTVGLVLSVASLVSMRNSYFVQNVVFHADQSTVLEDPNQLRVRFWRESTERVLHNPIGSGPGTAGLASIRNNVQGTELNENYYLQIASEVGILGLLIFLTILVWVAYRLLLASKIDWLAFSLFASFIGLLITNFLVHIWSNEAVAYTWWGLAGLIILAGSRGNSNNKKSAKN